MIPITLYNRTYHLPQTWDEIPYKTHLKLAPILFNHHAKGFPYAILTHIIPNKIIETLPLDYLEPLLKLLEWTTTTIYYPSHKILNNSIDGLTLFTTHIYRLEPDRLSIFQLAYAHIFLRQLENQATLEKALDEITFTLLLFDNQKEYTEEAKEANQKAYGTKITTYQKILIALWFVGWHKTTIIDRYGSAQEPEEETETTTPQPNQNPYGYFPLIVDAARSQIYGTYEQVCKVPAHTIFFNAMICK